MYYVCCNRKYDNSGNYKFDKYTKTFRGMLLPQNDPLCMRQVQRLPATLKGRRFPLGSADPEACQ